MDDLCQKLERVFSVQSGGEIEPGVLEGPFILTGLYLKDADLDRLRPFFDKESIHPNIGEVGRFQSVPVFPIADCKSMKGRLGSYQGIIFAFVPMLIVN